MHPAGLANATLFIILVSASCLTLYPKSSKTGVGLPGLLQLLATGWKLLTTERTIL